MSKRIFVRFTIPALHYWPDAPVGRDYLARKHRHLFYVKVEIPVIHGDREVEYHDLLMQSESIAATFVSTRTYDPRWSCEDFAEFIALAIARMYQRYAKVEVSEDNENGSVVMIFDPPMEANDENK